MLTNAPRTRSRTRVCKNQKISLHFSRVSSPHPSTAKRKKKWKGNFWFCFAVSDYKMNIGIILLCDYCALFIPPSSRRPEALSYPRSVVALESANHTQPPTHSPLAFARAGCFGVVCVRLVAPREFSGDSKNMDCAKAQTNLYVLDPPSRSRTENHSLSRVAP